jgi:hypothetical protein
MSNVPFWLEMNAANFPSYDIQWQTYNSGVTATNYGVSKGLEIIPEKNVEVILAIPPYIVNNPILRMTDSEIGSSS